MTASPSDVVVVGGGPAGLTAALLLAKAGAQVALCAPQPPSDARTTALLDGSVAILRELGVWDAIKGQAAPLRSLRIVDASRRLVRTPEAIFHADELGLEAFGWNVPNVALTAALREAFVAASVGRLVEAEALESRPGSNSVVIQLSGGEALTARLAIAADGRSSRLRAAAGVTFKTRKAPQTALAFAAAHERDHDDVSTELHYPEGPFTLVPLPGRRSSIVWATRPDQAAEIRALKPEALSDAATAASFGLLGRLRLDGPVGAFPIVVGAASNFGRHRTMLVGEAGHVLPPIGAQGLNLGIRDAAAVAKVVGRALAAGRDPGGLETLRAYAIARAPDAWTRTAAADLLNRSLMSDLLPVQAARSLGFGAIARLGPLRRFVMREGLAGGPSF